MSGLQRRTGLGRSGPLGRGEKPLTRTAPLFQGRPIKPSGRKLQASRDLARQAKPRTKRPKPDLDPLPDRRPARTGPARDVRAAVLERDGGRCVRCNGEASNLHHRVTGGMGGRKGTARALSNSPGNLLSLCGSGTTGCHGWATENPTAAGVDGYVVLRNAGVDPQAVPVRTFNGWFLFTHDGDKVPSLAPPDYDAREVAA